MLTKEDLNEIKVVVKEVVIETINEIVPPMVRAIVKEELKPIKKELRSLRKDLNTTIRLFDREIIDLKKRTARIEYKLDLPPIHD